MKKIKVSETMFSTTALRIAKLVPGFRNFEMRSKTFGKPTETPRTKTLSYAGRTAISELIFTTIWTCMLKIRSFVEPIPRSVMNWTICNGKLVVGSQIGLDASSSCSGLLMTLKMRAMFSATDSKMWSRD